MSSYVPELTAHLARFAERCRAARWFGPLFHVHVAEDITADIAKQQATTHAIAVDAEHFAVEALARIEDATAKDSDGGAAITPKELREIRPLIVKSATLDHRVAGMTR